MDILEYIHLFPCIFVIQEASRTIKRVKKLCPVNFI
jgi:hypothetical protein